MPKLSPEIETFARIKVIGVGGSGKNALNHMVASKVRGVEFIAIDPAGTEPSQWFYYTWDLKPETPEGGWPKFKMRPAELAEFTDVFGPAVYAKPYCW
jgi:hypothetical protein